MRRFRQSGLARNSAWMLVGQGLRIIVQAVYFVIIARVLGVRHYGAFIGAAALIAALAPFATWGAGNVLIKNVARRPASFRYYWGAALHATFVSAAVLGIGALAISIVALPDDISPLLVVELILADLFFARLVDLGGQAFQSLDRLSGTAATQLLLSFVRLGAAVALLVASGGHATAAMWGGLYSAASAMSAIVVVWWVYAELGPPLLSARLSRAEAKEGFHFAVTNSAATIYGDIDKTMLARLATLDAAGFYAAAYRILDVSFVPVRSVLFAAYSRFFSAGQAGLGAAVRFASRILPTAIGYSTGAGMAIYVLAPVVPRFLGREYESSVVVLRMLCMLPLIRTCHYFAADALTGADRQALRTSVQAIVAAINVALNIVLIPRFSWRGAVWSTVLSDGLLAVGLWSAIYVIGRRAAVVPRDRVENDQSLSHVTARVPHAIPVDSVD